MSYVKVTVKDDAKPFQIAAVKRHGKVVSEDGREIVLDTERRKDLEAYEAVERVEEASADVKKKAKADKAKAKDDGLDKPVNPVQDVDRKVVHKQPRTVYGSIADIQAGGADEAATSKEEEARVADMEKDQAAKEKKDVKEAKKILKDAEEAKKEALEEKEKAVKERLETAIKERKAAKAEAKREEKEAKAEEKAEEKKEARGHHEEGHEDHDHAEHHKDGSPVDDHDHSDHHKGEKSPMEKVNDKTDTPVTFGSPVNPDLHVLKDDANR